jgi:hypothetical protein
MGRRAAYLIAALAASGMLHLWMLASVWSPAAPPPTFGSLSVTTASAPSVFRSVPLQQTTHEESAAVAPLPVDRANSISSSLSSIEPAQVSSRLLYDGGANAGLD